MLKFVYILPPEHSSFKATWKLQILSINAFQLNCPIESKYENVWKQNFMFWGDCKQ